MEREIGDSQNEMNNLAFWYPRLVELGIPTPKTVIEELTPEETRDLVTVFDGADPPILFELKRRLLHGAMDLGIRPPYFLRTGYASGKHDWERTCFVEDAGRLDFHIVRVAEFNLCAGMLGLPISTWAIREMITTSPICHCRAYGNMPVTEEWRIFVRDGVVEHIQPYWPPGAVRKGDPDRDDWEVRLAEISDALNGSGVLVLKLTQKIGKAFGGYWSVDWLRNHRPGEVSRPWVCIDMALGGMSFRWQPGMEVDVEDL